MHLLIHKPREIFAETRLVESVEDSGSAHLSAVMRMCETRIGEFLLCG